MTFPSHAPFIQQPHGGLVIGREGRSSAGRTSESDQENVYNAMRQENEKSVGEKEENMKSEKGCRRIMLGDDEMAYAPVSDAEKY